MPRLKGQRNEIKYKYSKHEVVWAKIAGFPWWPASVTCTPSKNNCFYKVDFIGDRSYAFLSESKIAKYVEFRDQYQLNKKNNKNFTNAVTIAARKYQQLLAKQGAIIKSKGSVECKTAQQKQQLNKQIELPQIQEKIQQSGSQNQIEKNQIDKQIQQDKIHQQIPNEIFYEEEVVEVQEQQIEVFQKSYNEMQSENSSSLMRDNREKLIEQLLAKYKLNSIPILNQLKKPQKQLRFNDKRKLHWKRKLIFKGKRTSSQRAEQDQLIVKKIYRYLIAKLPSISECRQISISLKDQIVKQKEQKADYFKKIIDWITTSDSQTVVSFHAHFQNFYKDSQRQRQKHSTLTMEDESQELSIK